MNDKPVPNTIGYDVDYVTLDAHKIAAMAAARQTATNLFGTGFAEIPESRGESVYLIEGYGMILAFVVEGVGTLNTVAEELLRLTGVSYMAQLHRANFATIDNDLGVCGARSLIANALISVGEEEYFKNAQASADSISGWKDACNEVGCAWGGGETQKLRDVVVRGSAVLAGAGLGFIRPVERRIRGNVQAGDVIMIVYSSGIHANGVTMARDVAKSLSKGYLTELPNGQTFGQALLEAPHVLYGPLTQAALDAEVEIHYVSNITGHGWSKLMRLEKELSYVVTALPLPHPAFRFIQERSGKDNEYMYRTFNMGGGAAYIMPKKSVAKFAAVAASLNRQVIEAGVVEEGPRQVKLMPLDVTYGSEAYKVR